MSGARSKSVTLPAYFAGKRKLALPGLIALAVLQAVLAIVIAFKMRALFANLRNSVDYAIPVDLILIIATSSLAITGLRIVERALAEHVGYDYTAELRTRLFSHLSRISQQQLDQQRQGAINLRFVGDINAIKNWMSLGIPRLIAASILLPALLYLLYWLHPYMAAFAAVVLLLGVVIMYVCNGLLLPFHHTLRSKRGGIASYMNERIRFAPQLRISGQRHKIIKVLKRRSYRLKKAAVKKSLIAGAFKAVPDVCLAVISAGCFILAFHLQMGTDEAAVILAILAIFSQPLKDIAGFWDRRNAFNVASRKCLEILNTPSISRGQKIAPGDMQEPDMCTSKLRFEGQTFDNLTIPFNNKVLITGKNGCGKSSYLKLLAGITQPELGVVKLGGANVLNLPEQLRNQLIFYQATEVAIFKGTLKQALSLQSKSALRDNELLKIAYMFGLSPLLERLGGLEGMVDEGGRNISAGERKKIALCRAWISNSRILLLDEIDDALDKTSMSLLYKLLHKPNTTVLLISHRMVDSSQFDRVIDLSSDGHHH